MSENTEILTEQLFAAIALSLTRNAELFAETTRILSEITIALAALDSRVKSLESRVESLEQKVEYECASNHQLSQLQLKIEKGLS